MIGKFIEGNIVSIYSELLDQYIYDVDLKKLISFTIDNKLTINNF